MNRQITRLAVAALVLIVALIVGDDLLADVGLGRARRPAGQRDPARRPVQDQARPDLRERRQDGAGRQHAEEGRRPDPLLPHLPARTGSPRTRSATRRSSASAPGSSAPTNDYLTASNANLSTALRTTLDRLKGATDQGQQRRADDRRARRRSVAESLLRGKCGAAVALEPGDRARCSRSRPRRATTRTSSSRTSPRRRRRPATRASRRRRCSTARRTALYPPGSTFKVVTATAALDSGRVPARLALHRPRLLHRVRQEGAERRQPRPGRARGLRPA